MKVSVQIEMPNEWGFEARQAWVEAFQADAEEIIRVQVEHDKRLQSGEGSDVPIGIVNCGGK